MAKVSSPGPISEAEARNAVEPLAVTVPAIPYSMSDSARQGVLADLGAAVSLGAAAVARGGAYDHSRVVPNLNAIIAKANTLGAVPAMALLVSLDYNGFVSACKKIATGLGTIP